MDIETQAEAYAAAAASRYSRGLAHKSRSCWTAVPQSSTYTGKPSMTKPLAKQSPAKPSRPRQTRLSPDDRRRELLDAAILYFAEEGFDGGTRGLAKRLGITQPLLYRYFSSKEDLVNEVYRAVYLDRWQADWETTILNRDRPIEDRLLEFYRGYTDLIFDRNWMRIFFFAGLKGLDLNKRYIKRVETVLLTPIWAETSIALGVTMKGHTTEYPHDLVWQMHGAILYHGIRKHIYADCTVDIERTILVAVQTYLSAARATIA
ncbi:MAG: TetR/AcrR family transcriptional regulator [Betaproteobacteria bacterium]|nr:TetR/AcrR family transcriptional regulator [Betaproteobacteria bacterium]MBM3614463.1 TetR/AcrR family transcriptional regulator [Alphaproteobacteria bacterium]